MTYTITFKEMIETIFTLIGLIMVGFALYWMFKEESRIQRKFRQDRQDHINQICFAISSLKPDNSINYDCIADTLVDIADSLEVIKNYYEDMKATH